MGTAYTRTPFANNQIPNGTTGPNRIDAAAINIMSILPMPNLPGNVNNYYYASPQSGHHRTTTGRWITTFLGEPLNRLQNYVDLKRVRMAASSAPTCY